MPRLIKVAQVSEIPALGRKIVTVEDTEIAVFNVDGQQFYAVEDVCSHDGGPIGEGEVVDNYEVVCPRHGARFDLRTGQALTMPAFEPIEAYEVVVKDGDLYLKIDW